MKTIKDIKNLKDKRVLLRVDFNIPIKSGIVLNDFKIKKIIPTIDFLQKKGAKIIIISHIGREKTDTLKPIFNNLKKYFDVDFLTSDIFDNKTKSFIENMKGGEIVLLENLRKYDDEQNNETSFAKQLASMGDIFVNESFATSHRNHASIVGIPKYLPSYIGILFAEEIKALSQSFNPYHPAVFVLGGNKFETKLPLIKKVLKNYDIVFVGGALANNFFKEQGLSVGISLVAEKKFDLNNLLKDKKLFLPVDVVVKKENKTFIRRQNEVLSDEKILDAGPETILLLKRLLKDAKFVLFNGPLGDYTKGFNRATSDLIRMISDFKIKSIAGGGDTVANIFDLGLEDKFDFISTGGGAMLEFLTDETLPGIIAIQQSQKREDKKNK